MVKPEILCRGSGILLNVSDSAMAFACSRHVMHPMDFPNYAPAESKEWLDQILHRDLSFSVSVHHPVSGKIMYETTSTVERKVAVNMDLGMLTFQKDANLLTAMGLSSAAINAPFVSPIASSPLAPNSPLSFNGHFFVGFDTDHDQENPTSVPREHIGHFVERSTVKRMAPGNLVASVEQVTGLCEEELSLGFCGGPVLNSSNELVGMIEGLVTSNKKMVAVIPIDQVHKAKWREVTMLY